MITRELLISNTYNEYDTLFEKSYMIMSENLIDRQKRPTLLGKFIYIDERKLYDNKENGFWHSSSMGLDDTKFESDPCTNDVTKIYCKYRCNCNHEDNFLKDEDRVPCLYRADRIPWLLNILKLVNEEKKDNIKVWTYFDNKKKEKHLKVRYENDKLDVDYILIFRISYNKDMSGISSYRLVTSYPVVLKSYKDRFDREYSNYLKTKK